MQVTTAIGAPPKINDSEIFGAFLVSLIGLSTGEEELEAPEIMGAEVGVRELPSGRFEDDEEVGLSEGLTMEPEELISVVVEFEVGIEEGEGVAMVISEAVVVVLGTGL
jgi:hypothetical protein